MNRKLIIVIVLTLVSAHALLFYGGLVLFLVNFISFANQNGLVYQWPTSAYEYYAKGEPKHFGAYDFVIIGSGPGGSMAANRLTEMKNWNVLLLEAGTFGNVLTEIPNLYIQAEYSKFNWGYNSTPQNFACLGNTNRQCHLARGKGVGGTSLINGLIYSRAHKSDYEGWAKYVGDDRWGYENVLKYFKKQEHLNHNNPRAPIEPEYHSQNGPNHVEYYRGSSGQTEAFLAANEELNYGVNDYNANRLGASPVQLNTLQGRRFHNEKAFLQPIRDRPNLHIMAESYVTRIVTTKYKHHVVATGVEFSHKGHRYYVEAKKEVILAAGVFNSPQILLLSGIGPRHHLEPLGIEVVSDLEVGSALRDHPTFFGLNFVADYVEPIIPGTETILQYLKMGSGALAIPGNTQAVAFYESSYTKGTGIPDIELMFVAANATSSLSQRTWGLTDQTYVDMFKYNDVTRSFIIYSTCLQSKSKGTVRLKSKDPYEYPLIDIGLLSDPEDKDINTIYEGVQIVLRLMETKAFRAINARLQGFLTACLPYGYLTKDYWYCAIRQLGSDYFHPMCSNPMGRDPREGAVVDNKLRVFGVDHLRIADSSIFPFPIAGHLNTPTLMVGEQLGDILKETYNEHAYSFRRDWSDMFLKK